MGNDWSISEVEAIVESYFRMLSWECMGEPFVKAEQWRALSAKLYNRSKGSIEFKYCNISAILSKYNHPYVWGYKPRGNYQKLLEEIVLSYMDARPELHTVFEQFATGEFRAARKKQVDYTKIEVAPPPSSLQEEPGSYRKQRILSKPNYLQMEQQNRHLGALGEQLIFEYEQWRLRAVGKDRLADQVEWIARDQGDGAGFDILSRNNNGTDRYIEVKTTKLGESVPVYLTRNELLFSQEKRDHFYLYRVFNFYRSPRFFVKQGAFDEICRLEAVGFVGWV